MPRIRIFSDFEKLAGAEAPTPAEQELIRTCRAGKDCNLVDGELPEEPGPDWTNLNPDRTVRAELLRYLILGGCPACPVDERGVFLKGAYITGVLDLDFATARGVTGLFNCRFQNCIEATQAKLNQFNLSGSRCNGIRADFAEIYGSAVLAAGFSSIGKVDLNGATITGSLDCTGGSFYAADDCAIFAYGAAIGGYVYLTSYLHEGAWVAFKAVGEVSFAGAQVGRSFYCSGGSFDNELGTALNLESVKISGSLVFSILFDGSNKPVLDKEGKNLQFQAVGSVLLSYANISGLLSCSQSRFECKGDSCYALRAERMTVAGGFFWRDATVTKGRMSLISSNVGDLIDGSPVKDVDSSFVLASWPTGGNLLLDGFTYARILESPIDAKSRLDWLKRSLVRDNEFKPQPYVHLASVMRAMGHDQAAAKVLVEQARLVRHYSRERDKAGKSGLAFAKAQFWTFRRWLWDRLEYWIVGYGYRPWNSFWMMLILVLFTVGLAHFTWINGGFVPRGVTVPVAEWRMLAQANKNPAAVWSKPGQPGEDHEAFNSLAWGIELAVPVISFGQTAAWAPSANRGNWAFALWIARWPIRIAGWFIAGLAAGAVSGVIRRA